VQWEEQEQPDTPLFALLVRAARERAASHVPAAVNHDGDGSHREPLRAPQASG
jgi:hypothetical protein